MTNSDKHQAQGHRYPQYEARSLFQAPSWTALAVATFGLLVAFATLRQGRFVVAIAVAAAATAHLWPLQGGTTVGGRVAAGWRYIARRAIGRDSDMPALVGEVAWPKPVGRIEVLAHDTPRGPIGVVCDDGSYLAAMRIVAPSAVPLQDDQRGSEVADDWAGLISSAPVGTVDRIQVVMVARAGGARYQHDADAESRSMPAGVPAEVGQILDGVDELLAERVRHVETVVVVRLSRRAAREAARVDGRAGTIKAAAETVGHLVDSLTGGVTEVLGILTPSDWCGLLERQVMPGFTDRSLLDPPSSLPPVTSVVEAFKQVWTGDSGHRTWWVSDWPQRPVKSGWWGPFASVAGDVVVSITMRPEDPIPTQRRLQFSANRVASSISTRKGRSIPKERELDKIEQTQGELADGHVPLMAVATITATGVTVEDLDRTGLELTQRAARSGLRLAPLHGRHAQGWAWSLPLARGLGY